MKRLSISNHGRGPRAVAALSLVIAAFAMWSAAAQAVEPATVKVWNITPEIGHNPDSTVADVAGATVDVATAEHPLTQVTTIDNTTHPEGPCGLIYDNPATNAFEWWGVGGGVTSGLDLNTKAPTLTGPSSTVFGPVTFKPGDVWVTIDGSPPLYVKLKGTPNFREYLLPFGAKGVRVDEASGLIDFTGVTNGSIDQLNPATGGLKSWAVGGEPQYVAIDSAGRVYSTVTMASVAGGADAIVRVDPSTNTVTSWPLPAGSIAPVETKGHTANGVTIDAEGNVWVSESGTNEVARLTPSTNMLSQFSKPGIENPQQIASSGSGAIAQTFFTEDDGNSVSLITPSEASPSTTTVTPIVTSVEPTTSVPPISDIVKHPRTATITPETFTVPGADPTGITRFAPMPTPPGGNSLAPNNPSGMTQVALPNTIFGTYLDEMFGGNSAVFEFTSKAIKPPPTEEKCPVNPPKMNVRWHYSANGSAGSWSETGEAKCGKKITLGPQAMEGDLKVSPGKTIKAGYDFTLPGNKSPFMVSFTEGKVVFKVHCASGATPSEPTFEIKFPNQTYSVTNSEWSPSGEQNSPLVYQGETAAPDLCAGGQLRLDQGGTFSAFVTIH